MLSEKSSRKINILSFILFIGVMSIHTYNLEVYGIEAGKDSALAVAEVFIKKIADGTCVSFFFMISGFLFFRNFDLSMLLQKYKSRVKSIVIPYVAWNTIYYLYYVCVTRIPLIAGIMNGSERMSVGIIPYVRYVWSGYYTLWFLRDLIYLIMLAPLWYLLLKRRKNYWPEGILVLLILAGLDVIHISGLNLNVYYILGAYLGMNYRTAERNWSIVHICNLVRVRRVVSVSSAVFFPVIIIWGGGKYAGRLWYNCLLFAIVWLMMDLFSYKREGPWWVKCTFFYYCAHDMILEAVEKIILIVGGRSMFMAWADYILAPAITLIILIVGAWMLHKYMPPVWGLLSGWRESKAK